MNLDFSSHRFLFKFVVAKDFDTSLALCWRQALRGTF